MSEILPRSIEEAVDGSGEVAKTFPSSFNWKWYFHDYSVDWKFQIDTPVVSALCVKHSEKYKNK